MSRPPLPRPPLPGPVALGARDLWLLAATCAVALAARVWRLEASLWYDEVLTLIQFVRLPLAEIVTTYSTLNNHVFFSLQAHAAVALFGETAWALRLPAVLAGVASVPVLFALVRRIGAPLAWAHVAALLLALNYHHIWFSQNARGYTGLILWCLLATLAFVAGSRRAAAGPWIWFSLAAAAALYTHLSAAFHLLSLGLIYAGTVLVSRAKPGAGARTPGFASPWPLIAIPLTFALVAALYAPVIPQMITAFSEVAPPETAGAAAGAALPEAVPAWRSPLWTLLEILRSLPLPLPVTLLVGPLLVLVLGLGFVAVWRLDRGVALVLPVSALVTLAVLAAAEMRIWPRYFLTLLPFLLLMATAGTAVLAGGIGRMAAGDARRLTKVLTGAGWTLGILASLVWAGRNYAHPKQDFQGAVALVEAESRPGDIKASLGLAALPISGYFAPDWTVIEDAAGLNTALASGHPVWLVYAFEDHSRGTYPALMARLDAAFAPVQRLPGTLGGGTVHVLRSVPAND